MFAWDMSYARDCSSRVGIAGAYLRETCVGLMLCRTAARLVLLCVSFASCFFLRSLPWAGCPTVAIDLQVGEQRPQDGKFSADGAIVHASGCEPVTPGGDMLRRDGGQVFESPGLDTGIDQELAQVVLVGFACVPGGGAEQPGSDRPADIAQHLTGKSRGGNGPPAVLWLCPCLSDPPYPSKTINGRRPGRLVRITHLCPAY